MKKVRKNDLQMSLSTHYQNNIDKFSAMHYSYHNSNAHTKYEYERRYTMKLTLEEKFERIKDLRPIDDVFFEVFADFLSAIKTATFLLY